VLTVTENAATVIKGLVTSAEESHDAGLRIGAKDGADHLAVEIAAAPMPEDAVIEDGGARVFLDPVASPQLTHRQLDALIEGGSVRFVLRDQD
jgi:iron-sulfur cluster assembly protein